jgi:capsular polysaccharide export protein
LANSIGDIKDKNILFLQGPMGTFFKKVDKSFKKKGANTYKIGFNMGDWIFSYHDNYTPYTDTTKHWEKFITNYLISNKIDMIFLFGDCRFYQKIARKVAYNLNIKVYVFEEGYIRPHYITMELFGVNGFSDIPKNREFYQNLSIDEQPTPKHAKTSKTKMILSASAYYAVSNLFYFKYPHYIHHRDFSAIKELFYGIRGMYRKLWFQLTQRKYHNIFQTTLHKKYYFIPLQTHNDFQILQHSNYKSVEKFIIQVLESFASNAPKDTHIVFKHHPVDRGRKDYTSFICEQAKILGIEKRVISIHDVFLPTCIKNAKATITINSTVGLTAIGYEIPTITLGNAIYDIDGLTSKGVKLDDFWVGYKKVDINLYKNFKNYIIKTTQLNGSFYGIMPQELL